jgi:uncharacterized membrane protein YhhN
MTIAFLVLAGVAAVVDWVAVARIWARVEHVMKPLTLALLIVAAVFADMGHAKPWVVGALALGLLGDVALMFAGEGPDDAAFMTGLGAFLAGHVAYLIAFARHGVHSWQMFAGGLIVAGISGLVLPPVVRGAHRIGGSILAGAVSVYSAALAAMVILGFGTTAVATAAGALLFLASDSVLAWSRFVRRLLRGDLIVMVTYHLAQVLIVIGLIRW